jgi:hypothetical protein
MPSLPSPGDEIKWSNDDLTKYAYKQENVEPEDHFKDRENSDQKTIEIKPKTKWWEIKVPDFMNINTYVNKYGLWVIPVFGLAVLLGIYLLIKAQNNKL